MNKYLFVYSIGPVQKFIAQARKIQDLYAGSQILSTLIGDTITELSKNAQIIFPDNSYPSKPNRIIAILNCNDPEKAASDLEKFTKEKFKEYVNSIYHKFFGSQKKPDHFDEQIEKFLQIRWVYIPYDSNDYKNKYIELENLFNSSKNIKKFEQIEECGRKCSLCGERNALIYNTDKRLPRYIQNDALYLDDNSISHGEGLCSVCFFKRFYKDKEEGNEYTHSDSTASVSIMDVYDFMEKDYEGLDIINNYKKIFKGFSFNDELFFRENMNEAYFIKNGYESLIGKIEKIKEEQEKIYSFCRNKKKLKSYYAIVAFDGDSMGSWFSGDKIADGLDIKSFQMELSKALGKYAKYVKGCLVYPKGTIIYAGGEDYIGFVNLNCLFNVIKELREKFDSIVNKPLKKYFKNKNDNITFSAGIVIAHYKAPLSNVLKKARDMVDHAKDLDGKDGFSMALLKHSGEVCEMTYKWYLNDYFILDFIKEIIDSMSKNIFSDSFMKNSGLEFETFINNNVKFRDDDVFKSELNRLIERSYLKNGNRTEKDKTVEFFENIVAKIYESSNECEEKPLKNLFSTFNIVDFYERVI